MQVTKGDRVYCGVAANHLSIVVYQVCWRQLRTVCRRIFRNRWRKVGEVVQEEI